MSAVLVPVDQVTRAGVAQSDPVTTTSDGATVAANDGLIVLEVTNPGGGDATIALVAQVTVAGVPLAGESAVVPAGTTRWVGPIPPAIYNDPTDNVQVTTPAGLELRGLHF